MNESSLMGGFIFIIVAIGFALLFWGGGNGKEGF